MSLRRAFSGVSLAAAIAITAFSPAQAQEAVGEGAKVQKFGTWSSRCEKTNAGVEQCHAFTAIGVNDESGQQQRVLYLGIGYGKRDTDNDGKNDLFMFAITPLGTLLPSGIAWQIDGKNGFNQQFLYCLPGGCQTEILLTEERVKAIKAGSEMEVAFRLVTRGEVKIPVKLDGVSKAIDSLPKPKT
ncbi:invasion associated locus B family protein [Parvibaculum sp.]|jgi:invasion protein IalB|uniref:invasion associated locus B family protein n=1 Tax=Parvibaculum sp. TaxID=2024848 RepID=UPI00391BDE37